MIKFNNKDNIPKIDSEELSRVVYNGKIIFPKKENVIYINQVETDPAKKITGDVRGDVIRAIRRGSHRYVLGINRNDSIDWNDWTLEARQLDDSDSTKYSDGTDASQDIASGDVMVHIPEFWYYGTEGDNVEIHFIMEDPGDDDKWVHWDGNTLIGAYEGTAENFDSFGASFIWYSKSGVQSTGNISHSDSINYAENTGSYEMPGGTVKLFSGFQLVDWEIQNVIAILFYAWYGNTNCQAILKMVIICLSISGDWKIGGVTNMNGCKMLSLQVTEV